MAKLREALEPHAATIGDIPPFDLALAHDLYRLLLQPVEAGWRPARNLIVVTNGALALLPLSLLPTAPAAINLEAEPMFSGYRDVAWLARTHAVTMVPSAAALRTLRHLPPGSNKRETLIGFGDPYFSVQQAAAAAADAVADAAAAQPQGDRDGERRRGFSRRDFSRRNHARPAVAAAQQPAGRRRRQCRPWPASPSAGYGRRAQIDRACLQADPSKVIRLGKEANEETVKSSNLSKYRIIVFAIHGLVAGDLSGLTQPALALSAPSVTGTAGDGLLTTEEILALKLDADWVVLSACNTGAAAGAGAEAASGHGRAFFYAGTRAILVTNWSVHSASARKLVSDLFRRQAGDATLTRGEALRQAMTAMIDGKGFVDEASTGGSAATGGSAGTGSAGKVLFAYAHPLFWRPIPSSATAVGMRRNSARCVQMGEEMTR